MTDGPQNIDRLERPAQPPRPIEYPAGPLISPTPEQVPQIKPLNEPGKLPPNKGPQPI